ncbi:MAG: hypothetical protein HC890_02165 [Chloroflexaceae bacterium]|nr:hypothetical protein [Chloroflexaceae bacterium]
MEALTIIFDLVREYVTYLSESPRYQNLLNQLQEVELELADKSAIFLDNSPTIQALQEQRQNLLPLLEEEAQTILGPQFQGLSQSPSLSSPSNLRLELNQQYVEAANELQILELRRTALAQATTQLNQQVQQMPALARRYTDLQQKLEVSTENLKRLLEAEQQLELDAAQRSLTWQVISTPTPEDFETPIYPQPVNMMALGTVSGLLLGLIAAFVAERFDPVFHGPDEVAESCNLPILGYIPQHKNSDSVEEIFRNSLPRLQLGDRTIDLTQNLNSVNEVSGYQSSPFMEAFLSLNTNIQPARF